MNSQLLTLYTRAAFD